MPKIYYGTYSPSDVLVSVHATRNQALAALPDKRSWAVYAVEITETGKIARNIKRILGHEPGTNSPERLPLTPLKKA